MKNDRCFFIFKSIGIYSLFIASLLFTAPVNAESRENSATIHKLQGTQLAWVYSRPHYRPYYRPHYYHPYRHWRGYRANRWHRWHR